MFSLQNVLCWKIYPDFTTVLSQLHDRWHCSAPPAHPARRRHILHLNLNHANVCSLCTTHYIELLN